MEDRAQARQRVLGLAHLHTLSSLTTVAQVESLGMLRPPTLPFLCIQKDITAELYNYRVVVCDLQNMMYITILNHL